MKTLTIVYLLLFPSISLATQKPFQQGDARNTQARVLTKADLSRMAQQDSGYDVIGRWQWGTVSAVETDGKYLYVGNGQVFQVLDVSNPIQPKVLGEFTLYGGLGATIVDIKIKGHYAYVACGMFFILDISDFKNIFAEVGVEFNSDIAWKSSVQDSILYIATGAGYLYALDISNPFSVYIKRWIYLGSHRQVPYLAAKGRLIFTGSVTIQGVDIIEFDSNDSLKLVTELWNEAIIRDFAVQDSIIIVASNSLTDQILYFYSIVDPKNPYLLASGSYPSNGAQAKQIIVRNNKAYLVGLDGSVFAVDISNITKPKKLSSLVSPQYNLLQSASIGNYLYVAAFSGVWILNTKYDSLVSNGMFYGGGITRRIERRDSILFASSERVGLWILNVSNPTLPQPISASYVGGAMHKIIIDSGYVYLAGDGFNDQDTSAGIWVIDVHDVRSPKILTHVRDAGMPYHSNNENGIVTIKKRGNLLFTLLLQLTQDPNDTAMKVYDVSIPSNPVLKMAYKYKCSPVDIEVTDSLIYMSLGPDGMKVLKYNASSITPFYDVPTAAYTLLKKDSLLVSFADTVNLFRINGAVLNKLGFTVASLHWWDMMTLLDGTDLIAANGSLMTIYDIKDPGNIRNEFYSQIYNGGRGISKEGSHLYYSLANRGIIVINPRMLTGVAQKENEIQLKSFNISQNYPNPFNPSTTIQFDVPRKGIVKIDIYNILGKKVTTLLNEENTAGNYSVTWNGDHFPSGVYFYTIRSGNYSQTKKMLLMK